MNIRFVDEDYQLITSCCQGFVLRFPIFLYQTFHKDVCKGLYSQLDNSLSTLSVIATLLRLLTIELKVVLGTPNARDVSPTLPVFL